ncbi:MAG TPA: FHA domain-containing protein [Gemmatimonadaceae bacterium]|nr:FHA domain-containing protein [Gemmatimonadaceae bacterium]
MPSLLDANPLMVIAVSIVLLIATISIAASGVFLARKRAARRHRHGALPPMMVTGGRDRRDRQAVASNGKEAVQVLPGHLEVEVCSNVGEAIRFMRVKGEPADITIGAAEGPRHRHIKLPAETISRTHARMQYQEGRWRITNLSQNNPTLVNGQELGSAARTRLLDDGDMIQIGEMLLRFRAD